MPVFEVSTNDGTFEVDAPSLDVAVRSIKSGQAAKAGIGYGRAIAQGALIDTPRAFGGLADLLNPYRSYGDYKPGERPQFADAGQRLGESLIGPRQQGTVGEERVSQATSGALTALPFGLTGGPLAFAANLAGGAAGNVAQGEMERAGFGALPSAGANALVNIATGLAAQNAPKLARGLLGLKSAAVPAAEEVGQALASTAADTATDVAENVALNAPDVVNPATAAKLPEISKPAAAEFAGRAFNPKPVEEFVGKLRAGRFESIADDISTSSIRKVLRDTQEQFADTIDTARRGVRSVAVTEDAAKSLGMGVDELLARRSGQAFNAEELRAADSVLAQTSAALSEARDSVLREATDENLARLQAALSAHLGVQAEVAGATAEAGRALNILKQATKYRKQGEQIDAIIRAAGGRDKLTAIAQGLRDMETPGQVAKFVRDAVPATTMDKVVEAWKAALLTNPTTHAVNSISNAAFNALRTAEQGLTSVGESVRTGSTGPLREFAARLYGTKQGMSDGFVLMKSALKEEIPAEFSKAGETAGRQGAIGGTLGKVVRTPFRALGATDAMFRTVAEQQELHALAMRNAFGQGLRGRPLADEVARLVANPTEDMLAAAKAYGARTVFQQELGQTGKQFQRLVRSHPGLQMVVPFFKTPINLAKEAIQRMPTALVTREFWSDSTGRSC